LSAFLDPDEPPLAPGDPRELHTDEVGPEHPLWRQDNVVLLSVGIDIGTATTQVAFTKLHLQRVSTGLDTGFVVVDREMLFESAVSFTPYDEDRAIDGAALGAILDAAYRTAGVDPAQVDTGAVLITGDALKRVNAERVSEIVSRHAGDFVVAAAGHHMEAELAAHGSGAVRLSAERKATLLNIDIGGGTAKFSVVRDGVVEQTAALHVGSRHVVVADGLVVGLDVDGPLGAGGLGWFEMGAPIDAEVLDKAGGVLADLVLDAISGGGGRWWLTEPIADSPTFDALVFSGGVGEYVEGRGSPDFGDLGGSIGTSLRERTAAPGFAVPTWPADERIRATVLGAAGYTVQLSGLTTYASPTFTLPRRNVPVVRPAYDAGSCDDGQAVSAAIERRLAKLDAVAPGETLAVALAWSGRSEYARLRALAEGIRDGIAARIQAAAPTILIVDADVAMTLGRILVEELGVASPLLVLDGLHLTDFEYVDVGAPNDASRAMPVVVKSLVFR
jgi:ethanolamine utilization protein EutA